MGLWELLIVGVGLSMDAFAVAIGKGLTMQRMRWKHAAITGLWFGVFQAVMPLAGYFLGTRFSGYIQRIDHWIAFVLLALIGGNMILESRKGEDAPVDGSFAPSRMLPLAVATSIDALAVGVTFAFLQVDIVSAVTLIGCTTFVISFAGVKIGTVFGERFSCKAEFIGGLLLVLMGCKIVLQHLGVLG